MFLFLNLATLIWCKVTLLESKGFSGIVKNLTILLLFPFLIILAYVPITI